MYFIGGNDSDLARRRRENFGFFSRSYAFSKGILERRRRKFWDFSPDPSVPPYDSAEIGREGGGQTESNTLIAASSKF